MDNPKKPWYASKKIIILIVIVVLAIIGQFTNSSDKVENQPVAEKEWITGITNIKNMTFYDEEDKVWYWGVNFTTNEESGTKLYCDVTGLDKSSKTIVGEKHEYNVVNNGFAVRYGEDNLPTTDKDTAELLDYFLIFCEKL